MVTVSFDPVEYNVGEGDGKVDLILVKMGDIDTPVTVTVETAPGSATGTYAVESCKAKNIIIKPNTIFHVLL